MIRKLSIGVCLWFAVLSCCKDTPRRQDPLDPVGEPPSSLSKIMALSEGFLDEVEMQGCRLPYRPQMREWTRPSIISWREEARAVAIPRWRELPPGTKMLFEDLGGERFFNWTFRWFFPVHELAHFLQSVHKTNIDHAQSEIQANQMAVAYLRSLPGGEERLVVFEQMILKALAQSPDPTPPGEDSDGYFNIHYDELGQDPRRYGAFQWRFVADSLRHRAQLDFPALINQVINLDHNHCEKPGSIIDG